VFFITYYKKEQHNTLYLKSSGRSNLEEPKAHSFVEHVIQAEVLKRSGQGLERGRPSLRGRPFTTVRRKELSRHGLMVQRRGFVKKRRGGAGV